MKEERAKAIEWIKIMRALGISFETICYVLNADLANCYDWGRDSSKNSAYITMANENGIAVIWEGHLS